MEGSLIMIIGLVILSATAGIVLSSCKQCSPGEYMSSPCKCEPCPSNTFSDKTNNESKCRPCKTRCEPSMVITEKCKKTQDTKCSCKEGKFLEPGILFCVNCTVCPAGYGATRPCSTDSNTLCSPCIPGKSFSSAPTFSKPCTPCTVCPDGFSILKNCTNIKDTMCQVVTAVNSTQKTRTITSRGYVSTPGSSSSMVGDRREYIVPTVAIISILLILFLVILAFYLYKRTRPHPTVADHEAEDTEEAIPIKIKRTPMSALRHGGLRGRRTRHLRRADNSRESSDSQGSSTGSLQEDKPRNSERLLRDLPNGAVIIEKLSMLLNPKGRNNWIRLAGELGYSKLQIDYFNIDPTNSTQNLLSDWQTSKSSSIGVLYSCLAQMNRDDACAVLEDV